MLKRLSPNLMVEDVGRSIAYYTDVLGFNLVARVPEEGEPIVWAMLQRDDVTMMLQERKCFEEDLPNVAKGPIGASLTFFVNVAGINDLYEQLKGRVEIVIDLRDTWYGQREFAFKDPDGYVLMYGEDVPAKTGSVGVLE
jgi:uncharacterized glyoxalase superfamily protein PhnB